MLTPRAPLLAITIHPPCFTIRREHLFFNWAVWLFFVEACFLTYS